MCQEVKLFRSRDLAVPKFYWFIVTVTTIVFVAKFNFKVKANEYIKEICLFRSNSGNPTASDHCFFLESSLLFSSSFSVELHALP